MSGVIQYGMGNLYGGFLQTMPHGEIFCADPLCSADWHVTEITYTQAGIVIICVPTFLV